MRYVYSLCLVEIVEVEQVVEVTPLTSRVKMLGGTKMILVELLTIQVLTPGIP